MHKTAMKRMGMVLILGLLLVSLATALTFTEGIQSWGNYVGDGASSVFNGSNTFIHDFLTPQRLVNYLLVGLVLLGLAIFIPGIKDKFNHWGHTNYAVYIIIIFLAIMMTVHFVPDPNDYIWNQQIYRHAKFFMFGDSTCQAQVQIDVPKDQGLVETGVRAVPFGVGSGVGDYFWGKHTALEQYCYTTKSLEQGEQGGSINPGDPNSGFIGFGIFRRLLFLIGTAFLVWLFLGFSQMQDWTKYLVTGLIAFQIAATSIMTKAAFLSMMYYGMLFVFFKTFQKAGNSRTFAGALSFGIVNTIANTGFYMYNIGWFGTTNMLTNMLIGTAIGYVMDSFLDIEEKDKRTYLKRAWDWKFGNKKDEGEHKKDDTPAEDEHRRQADEAAHMTELYLNLLNNIMNGIVMKRQDLKKVTDAIAKLEADPAKGPAHPETVAAKKNVEEIEKELKIYEQKHLDITQKMPLPAPKPTGGHP
ncbi:hypothetical protein HZB02_00465 [Candidatus Woesearchaeota archaeon]|nr:hypothetical protein [Candidatus Woesearchaeota archaeon]